MRSLSNFPLLPSVRRSVQRAVPLQLEIRPAHEAEVDPALRVILGSHGRLANGEQVIDFLSFAGARGIDVKDLWVAARGATIVWAILPVVSPGRSMLLFAPPQVADERDVAPRLLIEAVIEHFHARGVRLAQVLIEPGQNSSEVFSDAGFGMLAELIYLQAGLRRTTPVMLPRGFSLRNYDAANHPLFAKTITASYEGSFDCPSLNGMRDIEDVIAGHKAASEFNPRLWFLLCEHDVPRGVLLLAHAPHSETMELVYLGLVRAARGRGIGDLVMRHALFAASNFGAERISLAVDASNVPALKLYRKHGLARVCSRLALVRDLGD